MNFISMKSFESLVGDVDGVVAISGDVQPTTKLPNGNYRIKVYMPDTAAFSENPMEFLANPDEHRVEAGTITINSAWTMPRVGEALDRANPQKHLLVEQVSRWLNLEANKAKQGTKVNLVPSQHAMAGLLPDGRIAVAIDPQGLNITADGTPVSIGLLWVRRTKDGLELSLTSVRESDTKSEGPSDEDNPYTPAKVLEVGANDEA